MQSKSKRSIKEDQYEQLDNEQRKDTKIKHQKKLKTTKNRGQNMGSFSFVEKKT